MLGNLAVGGRSTDSTRSPVRFPWTAARAIAGARRPRIRTSNRALWFATFLPLLVLYTWTMRTNMADMSPDPVAVAPSAWALAHLGTPALPASYWPPANPWAVHFAHGQVVSNRAPGLVLIAAPFYWLFHSASPWDQYPASIAAAFVHSRGMATLALMSEVSRAHGPLGSRPDRRHGHHDVGRCRHPVVAARPGRVPGRGGSARAASGPAGRAGFAFACAVLVRPPLAVIAALTGCASAVSPRSIRPAAAIGLSRASACSAACSTHGTTGTAGSTAAMSRWEVASSCRSWRHGHLRWSRFRRQRRRRSLAPGKGILPGSPFLLLLLPGLPRAWRAAPSWARSAGGRRRPVPADHAEGEPVLRRRELLELSVSTPDACRTGAAARARLARVDRPDGAASRRVPGGGRRLGRAAGRRRALLPRPVRQQALVAGLPRRALSGPGPIRRRPRSCRWVS